MRFRDLKVDQIFSFVGTGYGPCKKISARQYVDHPDDRAERAAELGKIYNIKNYKIAPHQVGTINVEVRV